MPNAATGEITSRIHIWDRFLLVTPVVNATLAPLLHGDSMRPDYQFS